ncbi:MAG: hypothetical protein COX07_06605 [Bacteroidetes bacterium CG23_combo_of_CG06-09_8_20_14_all_32_9]|nr:MAG: hypothetical protein COX07_06605 [Bacteroidetes bacterium CG23_combo_of_CG06-09_8_20_14_all_32_9]
MKIKKSFFVLFAAIAVYGLMILHHGYELGRSDNEQAAYGFYLNDNSLFPADFYIQSLVHQTPNERTFYGQFISFAGEKIPEFSFVFHIVFTIILLLGIRKISAEFIENEWVRWLAILVLFLCLYNIHLGGNELYYNSFIPSLPAKAIGVWGLWFFLQKRYLFASLLFSCSVFFQPLAGIQIIVISLSVFLIISFRQKRSLLFKNFLWLAMPAAFLTLPFLIPALTRFNDANVPDKFIFDVFFSFRNPHHFLPSYFPLKNYFILVPVFGFALIFFKKHSTEIMYFILVILLGCILYSFFVEILHSILVASSQWFKSTIWAEMFGVIAVFGFIEQLANKILDKYFSKSRKIIATFLMVFLFVFLTLFPFRFPWKVKYDFEPFLSSDCAIEISRLAKENTPINACFVTPIDFTELKFHGQRSSYIDYKLPVHSKSGIIEWMNRITRVYNIDYRNTEKGFEVSKKASENYYRLTSQNFIALKKFGVTHILTHISQKLPFCEVAKNNEFVIYKIP